MRPGPLIATIVCVLLAVVALLLSLLAVPTTLKLAVGPDDRDHSRVMAAFARKLQQDRAPLRLKLVRKESFVDLAHAIDSGEVDLAVVRSTTMPRKGLTVAVLHETPILFLVTGTSRLRSVADLKGRRVGVLRGSDDNMQLLNTVLSHTGVDPSQVKPVPLTFDEVVEAIERRQVDAILPVGPMQRVPTARMQALMDRQGARRMTVFGIDEAEAVVRSDPAMEAVELPRGALLASPPLPAEDLPTVAVTQRLVARASLSDSVVNDLTRLLFTGRVALAAEVPSAKAIHTPTTDTGEALAAALPLHPGAAGYLSGDQNRFFDRYGDLVYVGAMVVTGVVSGIGALFSWLLARQRRNAARFTDQLLELLKRARHAADEPALETVEQEADDLLALAFSRFTSGAIGSEQFDTFATVNDSVHQAIARRARQLAHQRAATQASALVGRVMPLD